MDGARIWNAAASSNLPLSRIVAGVDSVSVCYSKGELGRARQKFSSTVREVISSNSFERPLQSLALKTEQTGKLASENI